MSIGPLSLVGTLYAVVMVMLGAMFSVSEVLTETWLQTIYTGVYLVYMYLGATVFLIVLQVYIIPKSEKKVKASKEQSKKIRETFGPNGAPVNQPNQERLDQLNNEEYLNTITSIDTIMMSRARSETVTSSEQGPATHITTPAKRIENYLEKEENGSSFFLRVGILLFGIGNMIYIILEIEYHLINVPAGCLMKNFGWTFLLKLIFVIVQTFVLFKNAMIEIGVWKTLYDFGCKHVIATNMCVWIRTLISEIEEVFHHTIPHDHHKSDHGYTTDQYNQTIGNNYSDYDYSCQSDSTLIFLARPYLFPFVLEYSLIAVGVFIVMCYSIHTVTVPKAHLVEVMNEEKSFKKRYSVVATSHDHGPHWGPMQASSHRGTTLSLHSTHKGFVAGILALSAMLVSVIMFFYDIHKGHRQSAQMNYLISDISIHSIMILTSFSAMWSLHKLEIKDDIETEVDDMLLFVAMSGSLLFEVSISISSATNLSKDNLNYDWRLISLSLTSSLLAFLLTVIQTALITNGLRRFTQTTEQYKQLPGREAITFLIVCNLSIWIFRIFEVKELEMGIHKEFYGTLAWLFIMNLSLPLMLFFHFHSSACLADIWVEAYEKKPIISVQDSQRKAFSNYPFNSSTSEVDMKSDVISVESYDEESRHGGDGSVGSDISGSGGKTIKIGGQGKTVTYAVDIDGGYTTSSKADDQNRKRRNSPLPLTSDGIGAVAEYDNEGGGKKTTFAVPNSHFDIHNENIVEKQLVRTRGLPRNSSKASVISFVEAHFDNTKL